MVVDFQVMGFGQECHTVMLCFSNLLCHEADAAQLPMIIVWAARHLPQLTVKP